MNCQQCSSMLRLGLLPDLLLEPAPSESSGDPTGSCVSASACEKRKWRSETSIARREGLKENMIESIQV